MSLVNVSRLMNDPMFATDYTVIRSKGEWVNGRFEVSETAIIQHHAPVQPATNKELEQLPEGDRQSGVLKFFCKPPDTLYMTDSGNISDEIIYRGQRYKIFAVKDWMPNGYVRAFAYSYASADVLDDECDDS